MIRGVYCLYKIYDRREKIIDLPLVTDKLYHIMLYRVNQFNMRSRNYLPFWSTWAHPRVLVGFVLIDRQTSYIIKLLFVIFSKFKLAFHLLQRQINSFVLEEIGQSYQLMTIEKVSFYKQISILLHKQINSLVFFTIMI
jgi:hypothetical protein